MPVAEYYQKGGEDDSLVFLPGSDPEYAPGKDTVAGWALPPPVISN